VRGHGRTGADPVARLAGREQVATASGGRATPAASASPTAFDAEQGRKFAQCMRDNGIPDFPDPDPNGGEGMRGLLANSDVDRSKIQKAMAACRSLLPNGGRRPQLDAAQQEQLRQWAQCMRDNGVDVPDPDPNGGGFAFGGGDGQRAVDRNSPAFQKAMQACQDNFVFRRRPGQ
jgi:hypothetical protein